MTAMTRTDPNVDLARPRSLADPATGDRDLMRRLSLGDHDAMQMLIEQHGTMLARLVGRLTAWSADGDDILQDVLVKVWERAGTFEGRGSLEGWLRQIAIRQCHNHRRTRQALQRMLHRLIPTAHTHVESDDHGRVDTRELTRDALRQLDASDRTVLALYHLEDMRGDEIARALSISTPAVHTRLHRARRRLRVILDRMEASS